MSEAIPEETRALPLVSVIVPAYNAEKTLDNCLTALLSQTLERDSYEIIVVDNGSTDGTAAKIRNRPVLFIQCPVGSVYRARNVAVCAAHGTFLAFTDSDCIADAGWLQAGVLALAQFDLVGGRIDAQESPRGTLYAYDKYVKWQRRGALTVFNPCAGNMFVSRQLFDHLGGFGDGLTTAGDSIFAMRARNAGQSIGFAECAVVFHPVDGLLRRLRGSFREGEGSALKAEHRYPGCSNLRRFTLRLSNAFQSVVSDIRVASRPWRDGEIGVLRMLSVIALVLVFWVVEYACVFCARFLKPVCQKLARR